MTAFIDVEDGSVRVDLGVVEASLVSSIPGVIASLGDGDDPAARRLNLPVAPGEPEIDDAWWRLVGSGLEVARNTDAFLISEKVSGDTEITLRLDLDEAESMMRSVNHARLILAARMGLDVAEDYHHLGENDTAVLDFLGWMVEMLTDSLTRIRF